MSHLIQADAPDEIGTYFSEMFKNFKQPDLHAVFYLGVAILIGCFAPGLDSRRKLPEASNESSCRVVELLS